LSRPADKNAPLVEIESATQSAATLFSILNDHLATSAFMGGDRFTLADIPVGISVHRWMNLPIRRPAMPPLETWYERIRSRPAFQRVNAIPLR
jgi:glutathione S-transferase